ncbi:MAG: agmatinase [Bacteroidetes bacterium]|nr:agmatinase [Bacteroidota bacterium]
MISLLGIPYDDSSSYLKGAALAPERIRSALLSPSSNSSIENGLAFDQVGLVEDLGDLVLPLGEGHRSAITTAIDNLLQLGKKVVVLGGDHSISYPILRAYAKRHPVLHVIHFDAHPDLYDELDGDKYSHACPFARLLEEFSHVRLTQIGIRTLNEPCRRQAIRFGVRVFEMRDLPAPSLLDVDGPVYISLDLDVLDPAFAPGVSHYEPGGLSVREVLGYLQSIKNDIVGADIVELNPLRDYHDQTAMVAAKFAKEIVGQMVQNSPNR